jgi:FlaA1/EpsC-like NDP-sugar epimerase
VPPRVDLFARCVRGKTVLVTGAGGSIGSELCRQIVTQARAAAPARPLRIRPVHDPAGTGYALPRHSHRAHLGSVCNADLVERILRDGKVDTIYHAAAYKHVPLVETNIVEGLRNNVVGAQVIASQAARYRVETCVLISSDKAVRPTNIMGASKRIAELIFQAAAGPPWRPHHLLHGPLRQRAGFVRLGHPAVPAPDRRGGPLTITHPEVSRYFMLIPEAAQLVIQAGAMAKGGDVFVLDMGEPVRIVDLARTMIALHGLTEKNAQNPGGDIAHLSHVLSIHPVQESLS